MRNKGTQTTIIKRSGRKGAHAVHTGAWKVAFADFTLAMMALFMVLWIITAVPEDQRKLIMAYINGVTTMDDYPFTPLASPEMGSDAVIVINESIPLPRPQKEEAHTDKVRLSPGDSKDSTAKKEGSQQEKGETPGLLASSSDNDILPVAPKEQLNDVLQRSTKEMRELARVIMKITSEYNAQGNLAIEIVPQGLRILVQDNKNREMFHRGSAKLTPYFDKLLLELAPAFNKLDNKIIITGHTDAVPYRDRTRYNNWNLSGERALAARMALEKGGLPERHFIQVSGMADQMLLDPDNPQAAENRRIEIMVLTRAASDSLYQFFGKDGERVVIGPGGL